MRIAYPHMESTIEITSQSVEELIIENQSLFAEFISDIIGQINGEKGRAVLSEQDVPVEWSRFADISVQMAPFTVNRKPLLSKILQYLEKESTEGENYAVSAEILSKIELWVDQLTMEKSCDVVLTKLHMGSIFHAIGLEIDSAGLSEIEKIYQYMELVREFDRDRLFIFVNMRSYFSDEKMELFLDTVRNHDLKILLIESSERKWLSCTHRTIIDEDLCEIS